MDLEYTKLTEDLKFSRIVQGLWRITDWDLSDQELLKFTEQVFELGITTFDQADIYGNYESQIFFGNALKLNKSLRSRIQIVSKCGINLLSDKFPDRKVKHYDYSFKHIVESVEQTLEDLQTDYLDVLLLHRPSPFFDPQEVAQAFEKLSKSGKVLRFGVSNFTPGQTQMLSAYLDEPLVTNQVEISPFCLEHFLNGNIDFFLKEGIKPMAWSPLAGGSFLNKPTKHETRVLYALHHVAEELEIENIDVLIYAWLLNHPSGILPIVGSGKIDRVKSAVEALEVKMDLEQWFRIYESSLGYELP